MLGTYSYLKDPWGISTSIQTEAANDSSADTMNLALSQTGGFKNVIVFCNLFVTFLATGMNAQKICL